MKLTDALSALRSTSDQTNKFWGYYQAVTTAAVIFAWASTSREPVIVGLVVAYAIFAYLNRKLVVSSQTDARLIWDAIQNYMLNPTEAIESRFGTIPATNRPEMPRDVGLLHVGLSVLAGLAMLARLYIK